MEPELQQKLEANSATVQLVAPLNGLRQALEAHPPVEQDVELHGRATALLDAAERALWVINPVLVSDRFASDGAGRLQNVQASINAHGSVRQATAEIDNLADWVRGLPAGDPEYPFEALAQRLVEASDVIEAMRAERDKIIEGADTAERRMLDEIRSLREQVKFLKEQGQDAYTELAEKIHEGSEAFQAAVREHAAAVEEERVEIVKAARDAVDEAEDVVAQIREKLAIVSDESLSAGYDLTAKAEHDAANRFRVATLVLGAVAALAALGGLALSVWTEYQWAWERSIAKLSFVTAITSLAVYCSHQSKSHRAVARRYEDIALRLFNLGGYLAELDPPERARVRTNLVNEFFLGAKLGDEGKTSADSGETYGLIRGLVTDTA